LGLSSVEEVDEICLCTRRSERDHLASRLLSAWLLFLCRSNLGNDQSKSASWLFWLLEIGKAYAFGERGRCAVLLIAAAKALCAPLRLCPADALGLVTDPLGGGLAGNVEGCRFVAVTFRAADYAVFERITAFLGRWFWIVIKLLGATLEGRIATLAGL